MKASDPESIVLSLLESLEIAAACAVCGRLSLETIFGEKCVYCFESRGKTAVMRGGYGEDGR